MGQTYRGEEWIKSLHRVGELESPGREWFSEGVQPDAQKPCHLGFPIRPYEPAWMYPPFIDDDRLDKSASSLEPEQCLHGWWDTCAWYQSMHFFGPRWGIYIKDSCARREATRILNSLNFSKIQKQTNLNGKQLWKQVYLSTIIALYFHEVFHHRVESLAVRMSKSDRQLYYLSYKRNVYGPTWFTDDNLEEALANADAYRKLKRNDTQFVGVVVPGVSRMVAEYLKSTFKHNGPGYRNAELYLTDSKWQAGLSQLISQVHEGRLRPVNPPVVQRPPVGATRSLYVRIPTWIVTGI